MARSDERDVLPTGSDELTQVPKDLFERVWHFVQACDDREKHFNGLQSQYRTLASTWLLAAFGGIGFVLTTTLSAPVSWELLVSGIAIAGALGICLLWVVDMLIYHRLLLMSYITAKQLEETFRWLPPNRSHYAKPRQLLRVRTWVAIFYSSGIVVLCGCAILTLIVAGSATLGRVLALTSVGGLLTGIVILLSRSAIDWNETLQPWLRDSKVESHRTRTF